MCFFLFLLKTSISCIQPQMNNYFRLYIIEKNFNFFLFMSKIII